MKKIIKSLLVITITIIGFSAIAAKPYNQVVKSLKQEYVDVLNQHKLNIKKAQDTNLKFQNWITTPEYHVVRAEYSPKVTAFQSLIEEAETKVRDFEKFVEIEYIEFDDLIRLKPHDGTYLISGEIELVHNGFVRLNDKNGNYSVDIYCGDYPTEKFIKDNHLICQVKVIENLNNLTCIALNTRGYFDVLNDTDWTSVHDSGARLNNADKIFNRYYNKILPRVSALPCDEAVRVVIRETATVKHIMGESPKSCEKCGQATCNGSCIIIEKIKQPEKPEQPRIQPETQIPWEIIAAIVLVVLVIVVVIIIIALARPKKPTCARCGSSPVYQDGLCVNCWNIERTSHTCQKCGAYSHDIVNGKCLKCRNEEREEQQPPVEPTRPCCPKCDTPLDKNGVCPECTKVRCSQCGAIKVGGKCPNGCDENNDPLKLVWAEPEATRIYAKCALRVVGPEKFANFELRVPKIFDMGKSAKGFSTAFVELNMNGNPRANECSRQYVRLRENGEGFDVELLTGSGNTLAVDDATVTNKGECLFAKVGSTIKLQPDWYIQVIK